MLSKKTFCEALRKIQAQRVIDEKFSAALQTVGNGYYVFGSENLCLAALRDVLKESVNDQYDYIEWWLYEATPDYLVWSSDERSKWCLKEQEDLYVFIMDQCQDRYTCFIEMKGVTMSKLNTSKTKEELERVLGIMKPYIDECVCYDVVYSPKFGYLLIDLPGHDTIDDAEVVPLDDAATLLHKLFINLAYDFMEKNGHCTDYIEATDLEKYALRIWMKKYIDQLPEYRYILDDILSQ